MEKVTLPQTVADAIENYLAEFNKETLLHTFCDKEKLGWADRYKALARIDIETLLSALVNGYIVENSPEEKVREYYATFEAPFAERFIESEQQVIAKTLTLLGINIPGVNAPVEGVNV